MEYDPFNWFWLVGGDDSRAWSSATGAYVSDYPVDRVTRIASEAELNDVLRPYGLALPAPTADDYKTAIQAHIDETARSRNYTDGVSLASYKDSTVAQWAAEATAFIGWRDAVWASVYATLAEVQSGSISQPTISELIAMLPAPPWPS